MGRVWLDGVEPCAAPGGSVSGPGSVPSDCPGSLLCCLPCCLPSCFLPVPALLLSLLPPLLLPLNSIAAYQCQAKMDLVDSQTMPLIKLSQGALFVLFPRGFL